MPERYDDLDTYIANRNVKNPTFATMVEAALKERRRVRELDTKQFETGNAARRKSTYKK